MTTGIHIKNRTRPVLDGDRLARAVWSRGYSFGAFAKAAGISAPTLRRALGSLPINAKTAMRIAVAIGEHETVEALGDLIPV